MCFYNSVSNGLVLLLQWLITERSHEDLDNSSATNIYHRYMTLQLPVAILKCLHWTNVCSKHPKWLERTQPDAGGSGRPGESIAFSEMELPLSITWHLPSCVKSLVSMSAELSEEWLAFASEVCDPSRLRSQEHAASRRAVSSCAQQLPCSQRCLTDVTWRNHAFHANSPEVS